MYPDGWEIAMSGLSAGAVGLVVALLLLVGAVRDFQRRRRLLR